MSKNAWHDRLRQIKVVVCDVDGTLTDGGMYYFDHNTEGKKFNVRDGAGTALMQAAGIRIVLVSGEDHAVITRRGAKLKVNASFVGINDKPRAVGEWLTSHSLDWSHVACVGDEINDIPLMRHSAVSWAVAGSHSQVQREADSVLTTAGGQGVLREVADHILSAQGCMKEALNNYLESRGAGYSVAGNTG